MSLHSVHTITTLLFVALLATAAHSAEPPGIPLTNQVARYEREQPVFQSKRILRARGDALLALLDRGRALERWMKDGLRGVVCPFPGSPRLWMSVTLTNGMIYRLGLSQDGNLLHLPEGLYVVSDDTISQSVARWMTEFEGDLRREVVRAARPCIYRIGTLDDGGTLAGVARVFYGDASKWSRIYEANRRVLKSPHQITGSERLTIPQ